MKRIISCILALLLILTSLSSTAIFAIAAGTPTISFNTVEADAGGKPVSLQLSINNNPGIAGLAVSLKYDTDVLTLTETKKGTLFSGFTAAKNFAWDESEDVTADGVLATFTFAVSETATSGDYDIQVIVRSCTNEDLDDVVCEVQSGKISVKAKPVATTGVTLNKETLSLNTGESETLIATVSPDNATNKTVSWKSSDSTVVTVDNNGKVTAVKKGTATITVTTEDGNFTDTCDVSIACSHANTTVHPANASTCLVQGNAEYTTCNDCGIVVSGSDAKLPLADHKGGTATCKDKAICTVCSQPYGNYGSHTLTNHPRNEADHYNAGNIEYWTCDVCDKYFSDANGTTVISQADTIIEKVPHSHSTDWSKNDTQHWRECGCGNKIEIDTHKYTNACDTSCNVCGYTRTITHDWNTTYTTDGNGHWIECKECGEKKNEGTHSGGTATCKDKAICTVCSQPYGNYGSHTLTNHPRNDADHNNTGNIEYWTCDVCGKYFSDANGSTVISQADTIIAKVPHSHSPEWSKNDTQHWRECGCGNKIEIDTHKYTNDCDTSCNVCGYTRTITHDWNTTYTTDGNGHWIECKECGAKKNEGTHNGGTATCKDKAVCDICNQAYGSLANHSYKEIVDVKYRKDVATCVSAAVYYKSCEVCEIASTTETFTNGGVDGTNHVGGTYLVNQREADCVNKGYTGDKMCNSCRNLVEAGTEIPVGAHNPDSVWSTDAEYHWKDCNTVGCGNLIDKAAHSGGTATCKNKAICSVCKVEYGTTNAANHVGETEIKNAVEATCTTDGYTGDTYCKDCGVKIADGKTVEAGHKTVKVAAVPATHEKDGNIEYYTCSGCDKLFSDEKATTEIKLADTVIAKGEHNYGDTYKSDADNHWKACGCGNVIEKAAHTFGEWSVIKEATETEKGSKEKVCSVCGYKVVEEIPAVKGDDTTNTDNDTNTDTDADTNNGTTNDDIPEKSPQTGDTSNIFLWIAILSLSGLALIGTAVLKKKVR